MQDDFSRSDDLIHGIDYAKLRQDVLGSLKTREMSRDPIVFVYKIAQHCLEKYDSVVDIDVFLASIASQLRPKPRRSSHLTYQLKAGKVRNKIPMLMIASSGHFVNAKIGVMEGERDSPQPLRLSCKFQFQMNGIRENTSIEEWSSMAIRQTERSIQQALAYVQHSSCRTLEALVSKVVDISTETDISNVAKLGLHTLQSVIVSINKRRIFQDGTLPSVKITRRVDGFRSSNLFKDGYPRHYRIHRAFIAIGSNVGDRLSMIEEACKIMDSEAIKVVRTSSLYETKAMYVVDQDQFLNGVCQVGIFLYLKYLAKPYRLKHIFHHQSFSRN
jgi:dihydroneopterin aldolase